MSDPEPIASAATAFQSNTLRPERPKKMWASNWSNFTEGKFFSIHVEYGNMAEVIGTTQNCC